MLKKAPGHADDLFEKSSMSFGEHLEELRKALVKAFIWLGVGTSIGLFVAEDLVRVIAVPMQRAMKEFQIARAKMLYAKANGAEPSEAFVAFMAEHEMIPRLAFVDPIEIEQLNSRPLVISSMTIRSEGKGDSEVPAKPEEHNASEEPTLGNVPEQIDSSFRWKNMSDAMLARLRPIRLWDPMPLNLIAYNSLEGFMIWFKAGLVAGAVIASPGIFWHVWQFLAAGLYPHERRYVYWYLPLSVVLFLAGVGLAFIAIFPLVLGFLLTYNMGTGVDIEPRLNDYMSFALFLPLGFGLAFQLPLVMLALNRFGIVSMELFISKWRIAVLVIAFVSMILTPADIYSMLGMFIPLTFLYFVGILLCKFMPRGPGVGSQALDPQG